MCMGSRQHASTGVLRTTFHQPGLACTASASHQLDVCVQCAIFLRSDAAPWCCKLCKIITELLLPQQISSGPATSALSRSSRLAQQTAARDAQHVMSTTIELLQQQHDSIVDQVLRVHPLLRPHVPLAHQIASLPPLAHAFAVDWHVRSARLARRAVTLSLADRAVAVCVLQAAVQAPCALRSLCIIKPARQICPPAADLRAGASGIAQQVVQLRNLQSVTLRHGHSFTQLALLPQLALGCHRLTQLDLTTTALQRGGRESLAWALLCMPQLCELIAPACDAVQLAAAFWQQCVSAHGLLAECSVLRSLHTVSLAMVLPSRGDIVAAASGWQAFQAVRTASITMNPSRRGERDMLGDPSTAAKGAMLLFTQLPALAALSLHNIDGTRMTWLRNLTAPLTLARGLTRLALHSHAFHAREVEQLLQQLGRFSALRELALCCPIDWEWPLTPGSIHAASSLSSLTIGGVYMQGNQLHDLLAQLEALPRLCSLSLQLCEPHCVRLEAGLVEQLHEALPHLTCLKLRNCSIRCSEFAMPGLPHMQAGSGASNGAASDADQAQLPPPEGTGQDVASEFRSAHSGSQSVSDFASAASPSIAGGESPGSSCGSLVSQCPSPEWMSEASAVPSNVSLPLQGLPPLPLQELTGHLWLPARASAALFGFMGWLSDCRDLRALGLALTAEEWPLFPPQAMTELGVAVAALPRLTSLVLGMPWRRQHVMALAQQLALLQLRQLALVLVSEPDANGHQPARRGRGRGGLGGRHHGVSGGGSCARRQVQRPCTLPALAPLSKLTRLKALVLMCCGTDGSRATGTAAVREEAALVRMLQPLKQLRTLAVGGIGLTGDPAACTALAALSRLTGFAGELAADVLEDSIDRVVASLRQLPSLQWLLLGCVQGSGPKDQIHARLQGATGLTRLSIFPDSLHAYDGLDFAQMMGFYSDAD